jgi:tripartite-type tricarboxylate transporter receptor subunit TctC
MTSNFHARRRALGAIGASVLGWNAQSVLAQSDAAFPTKPIKLVVPAPPGGGTDLIARVVAEHWGQAIGQPVVIENIGGAAGSVGSAAVARAAPDGYTLLLHTTSLPITSVTQTGLSYDPLTSFAPISLVCKFPFILVVPPDTPARDLREFIALLKSRPKQNSYGTSGYGGVGHLISEYFTKTAGVEMLHVPYKGNGPALVDLMGGRLTMMFDGVPPMRGHVESGKVKAIAVTSDGRSAVLPQVPTMGEGGLAGFNLSFWQAVFAPAGTPAPVIARLASSVQQVMKKPEVVAKMKEFGADAVGSTPAELGKTLRDEVQVYKKIVADADIKVSN